MAEPTAVPDLSTAAIAERKRVGARTGQAGGWTGRQLIKIAAEVFQEANRMKKVAERRQRAGGAAKAAERALEALATAACQIRIAAATPLDTGYMHALDMRRLQKVQEEVARAITEDAAALAVDTHQRIRDQRLRAKAEGERR